MHDLKATQALNRAAVQASLDQQRNAGGAKWLPRYQILGVCDEVVVHHEPFEDPYAVGWLRGEHVATVVHDRLWNVQDRTYTRADIPRKLYWMLREVGVDVIGDPVPERADIFYAHRKTSELRHLANTVPNRHSVTL